MRMFVVPAEAGGCPGVLKHTAGYWQASERWWWELCKASLFVVVCFVCFFPYATGNYSFHSSMRMSAVEGGSSEYCGKIGGKCDAGGSSVGYAVSSSLLHPIFGAGRIAVCVCARTCLFVCSSVLLSIPVHSC